MKETWELSPSRRGYRSNRGVFLSSSSSISLSLVTKLTAIPKSLETTINFDLFNLSGIFICFGSLYCWEDYHLCLRGHGDTLGQWTRIEHSFP